MSKPMLLVSSVFADKKSFRLIPIVDNAPFSEGIYDIESKVLVLMSNRTKESFHLVPKLDDNGDMVKANKARPNGKLYREERRNLNTFTEYYVMEKDEIVDMIKRLADNSDTFNYDKYLNNVDIITPDQFDSVNMEKIDLMKP